MRLLLVIFLSGMLGTTLAGAGESSRYYFNLVQVPGTECRVSKDEVTQAQYLEVTGENPSSFQDPKRPVESVSWDDAVAFCEMLTKREHAAGRLPVNEVYDLPTDAQWDLFAAGSELKDGVTSLGAPCGGTEPVGTHGTNPLGLHDVVGNVWEWCKDWYDNSIRKKDSNKDMPYIPTDAEAAASGLDGIYKVLRGGAWDTTAADGFALGSRLRYAPGMSNYHTGFRCVVVKVDQAAARQRRQFTRTLTRWNIPAISACENQRSGGICVRSTWLMNGDGGLAANQVKLAVKPAWRNWQTR